MRIAGVLVAAAVAVLALYACWIEPSSIRVNAYDVPAPRALKGLRIAVISDLHAGTPYIDTAKIDRIVAMTNDARPDLILLAGDYAVGKTWGARRLPIETITAHLKPLHARLGVYAVLGNHDTRRASQFVSAFTAVKIPVLRNRHVILPGGIVLAGIDDYYTDADPALALSGVTRDAICLAHAPDQFPKLPPACALTIAGHTHGGQVWLPLLGRPAVARVASRYGQRYAIGVVRENGKTLFVSPGIGTSGFPVRFAVPPEISLLTLQ